jgi:ABC-type polysaccharide/polyol phosphate transport system ATPase subunit
VNLMRDLCDRVFYLEDGQFKTDGDKESAIKQYQSDKEGA